MQVKSPNEKKCHLSRFIDIIASVTLLVQLPANLQNTRKVFRESIGKLLISDNGLSSGVQRRVAYKTDIWSCNGNAIVTASRCVRL